MYVQHLNNHNIKKSSLEFYPGLSDSFQQQLINEVQEICMFYYSFLSYIEVTLSDNNRKLYDRKKTC